MLLDGCRKDRGGRQRQGSGEGKSLQIERRDQSKKIQKGEKGGQKKITTESLRRGEGKGGKKGGDGQRDGGDRKRNKKDRKKGKFGKDKKQGGKPKDADALDKELEGYWIKNGDRALGKYNRGIIFFTLL